MLLLITPVWAMVAVGQAATCNYRQVGPDTSLANTAFSPFLGEALGQTFVATDTLIESIRVWRWAEEDTLGVGYELYLVGTDSLGRPDVVNKLLLQSPVVYHYYGDGVHPVPITFAFDPPFALPAHGLYEFAIQLVPCTAFSYLLENFNGNPYPEGDQWRHSRSSVGGCYLRPAPDETSTVDMIFTITFCEQAVSTQIETWGRVKTRYR